MKRLFDNDKKAEAINRFALAQSIPHELLALFELWEYEKGAYLCREGEKSETFFLLVEGKLQIGYLHPNGHQVIFAFESPLSVIGEFELFKESDRANNVNVKAVEPVLVLATPAENALRLGSNDPAFLRFLLRYLARKIDFSSTMLSQVSLSAEARVARYLIGRMGSEGSMFELERREALAGLLGISMRHLNRTLSKMALQNLIFVKNKRVQIINQKGLSALTDMPF